MVPQIIGAILAIIIILGAMYGIIRNVVIFLFDAMRGNASTPWFQRPYLFRALAWTATLFWLYGPYTGNNNVLQFTADQQHITAFALYVVAAAGWLWVWHINFINRIPQHMLNLRFGAHGRTGWHWLSGQIYLVQLGIAIGVGALFAYAPVSISPILLRLAAFVLLLGSGFASLYRATYLIGPGHTLGERIQHAIGEHDTTQPAEIITAPGALPGESSTVPGDPYQ